jgi:L-2-hydroxyglutarate oxidase LhgO
MTALLADVEAAGSGLVLKTAVSGGRIGASGLELTTVDSTGESYRLAARTTVNCAGLRAPGLAAALVGFPAHLVPRQRLARGCYFSIAGKAPFRRLIYPVPVDGGLGVHLTLDLAGQARFGPDVEWIDEIDYRVDPRRADSFYAEIRRYWPEIAEGSLAPAYSGIRPKLSGPGEAAADFLIQGPREHGLAGLVNLFGIESPGLTSSLAIAELVTKLLS